MSTQELAQKILDIIVGTEQGIAQDAQETEDVDERIHRGIIRYAALKVDIKKLCEEQGQGVPKISFTPRVY